MVGGGLGPVIPSVHVKSLRLRALYYFHASATPLGRFFRRRLQNAAVWFTVRTWAWASMLPAVRCRISRNSSFYLLVIAAMSDTGLIIAAKISVVTGGTRVRNACQQKRLCQSWHRQCVPFFWIQLRFFSPVLWIAYGLIIKSRTLLLRSIKQRWLIQYNRCQNALRFPNIQIPRPSQFYKKKVFQLDASLASSPQLTLKGNYKTRSIHTKEVPLAKRLRETSTLIITNTGLDTPQIFRITILKAYEIVQVGFGKYDKLRVLLVPSLWHFYNP